jgi:FolB domain-containing protein
MEGVLGFENHRISCIIGAYPAERNNEQDIFVDLKVKADLSKPAKTDDLNDTIDYAALANLCTELARKNGYQLLEAFAGDVLNEIFSRFAVEEAWIKIKKPNAIETADYCMVEISRSKE